MTLRECQSAFARSMAELIFWVYEHEGWAVTIGEVERTADQQRLYVQAGKSRTMASKHCQRLAVDLFLFIDGKYQQSYEAYRPLGGYWKSLDPVHHVWGGDWPKFRDCVHFEYKR